MVCVMNWSSRVMMCVPPPSQRNTDLLLRTQLHQLHTEAEKTRYKASNARLRLMRLSEAATKLQHQAATDVRIGRENEARDLLLQKRRVMHALENSKTRIDMLHQLLAKLNQAISVKETQLIGNVSSGLDLAQENTSSNVRIISPKEDNTDIFIGDQQNQSTLTNHDEDHIPHSLIGYDASTTSNHQIEDTELGSTSVEIWNEAELVNSFKNISSYEHFLEHLDKQLHSIELELTTFLRLSTLVLETEEKPKNFKVQQAQEILENIWAIRKRILSITKIKARTN